MDHTHSYIYTVQLTPVTILLSFLEKKLTYDVQQKWGQSDLYRETPIRFLGYANEVGEAFRALVPRNLVRFSYHSLQEEMDRQRRKKKHVALTLLDTLAWQTCASVVLPGITINRLCAGSMFLFHRFSRMSNTTAKLSTTILGLAAIPFIVKPIDALVDVGMDSSLRKMYSINNVEEPLVSKELNT
uniref:Mitochondrial fission process protein 1 n=1 Tax=Ditylenchus dipsaci TaxID=166011 RepID=A0A915E058_9BILA